MKKRFLALLSAAVMVFATGCVGGGNNGGKIEPADPNKKATIEFYVWSEKALCQEIADSFHEIYPNWTVKVVLSTSDYYTSLKTYAGTGEMPDVFYMQPKVMTDFCRDGLLLNLSSYMNAVGESVKQTDLWSFNDSYRFDNTAEKLGSGDYYAFVKDFTPEFMMIYNKKHIDEYNQTHEKSLAQEVGYPTDEDGVYPSATKSMSWAQNEKMCALLSKFDSNGNFTRYGSNVSFEPWAHLGQFVSQLGGTLYDDDGYFNASSEAVIKSVEHLKNYMDGANRSAVKIGSSVVNEGMGFRNGDISVVFTGRWAFQQYDWMDADFEFGVAPPAMPEAEQETKSVSAMVGIAAAADSKYPAITYKFIEYYMTYGQKLLSSKGFNIPGNKTVAQRDYVNTGDAKVDALNSYFLSFVDKIEMVEINPWFDNTDSIFGLELTRAWAEGADRKTITAALASTKSSIDAKVDQNKSRYGR